MLTVRFRALTDRFDGAIGRIEDRGPETFGEWMRAIGHAAIEIGIVLALCLGIGFAVALFAAGTAMMFR